MVAPPEAAPGAGPPSQASETPPTTFTANGTEWIARVAGVSASGRGRPGSGAPLLLITFARADQPDQPSLEALTVGKGSIDLADLDLTDLLSRARPTPPAKEREDLFSDTHARKRVER